MDLCVVGGGISGVVCAYSFLRQNPGKSVIVLEARDCFGGKTSTVQYGPPPSGDYFDIGGQWICPAQPIIGEFVKELQLTLEEQLWFDSEAELNFTSGISNVATKEEIQELNEIVAKIEQMAITVTGPPWNDCPHARQWDSISVADYLNSVTKSEPIKKEIENLIVTVLAVSPEEVSFLYFLFYVNTVGKLKILGDGPFGAQHWKIKEGAQSISNRLVQKITSLGGSVRCNSIVQKISQNFNFNPETDHTPVQVYFKTAPPSSPHTTTTTSENHVVHCRHVVVAMSPLHSKSLVFSPQLPSQRAKLLSGFIPARAVKVILLYKTPFWIKYKRLKQQPIEDLGPITNIFPAKIGKQMGLVGLITAHSATKFLSLSDLEKKDSILRQISDFFFGKEQEATQPIYMVWKDWTSEPYCGGCYAALMPPGLATDCGDLMGVQWGRVSWAGTETARRWAGYFEGAAESGLRAANEASLSVRACRAKL